MEPFCRLILVFLWVHAAGNLTEELKVTQPGLLEVSSTKKPTLDCTHDCEDDVELKLTILKGKDKTTVCSGTIISSNQSIDARGLFHCQMKWLPNKISVIIYGFNSSLVNNYFCKIEKMYPPPYQCGVGDGTVIYINSEDRKCPLFLFILVVGILGFLLLLSVAYIFVLIIKSKTKKTNVNPVYEQMAPTRGR